MAVTNSSFSAAVDAWCKKSEARLEAVFKESCQRLVNQAQIPVGSGGNMPVDTGFLRSSGLASEGAPVPRDPTHKPVKGNTYTFALGQTSTVIANLKIGQTFFFCWTAIYSRRLEYGGPGRRAYGFVRLAAQNWQSIVSQVVREAKARAGE